jgi:hypothetical protein
MKTIILLIAATSVLVAQTATPHPMLADKATLDVVGTPSKTILLPSDAPIARETQLELQILADREKEIQQKLEGLYQLLIAPVTQARSDAVKRACELAGFPPIVAGKPACEIKDGRVRQIAPPPAGKEKP